MAKELQTLRKQYQEEEMRLTELQNKYREAKKTACWYKLWADGKERHIQQEWQRIVLGLQNVLQVVQGKAQAALTDSAVTDSAARWEDTGTARHTGTAQTQLKIALFVVNGMYVYSSIETSEQLHQTVFVMYSGMCQSPSFERPTVCHVTLIFIIICSNLLCFPDCHFKTFPNQSDVYIPCTPNHLNSPLCFPKFHYPDKH